MKHETFRELMALRLYRELDADDAARLDRHLATCADCTKFASELASGLGAVRDAQTLRAPTTPRAADELPATDLPANWRERLRLSTVAEPKRARISPWWTSVAAFAAGILAATIIMHRPSESPLESIVMNRSSESPLELRASNTPTHESSIYEHFNGSTPPPPANSAGQLARLGEYLRH